MKRVLKWIGTGLLVLVAVAAALAVHTWYAKPLSINWFYTRVFAKFALDNPELLTHMRVLEPLGIRGHNARLADSSSLRCEYIASSASPMAWCSLIRSCFNSEL